VDKALRIALDSEDDVLPSLPTLETIYGTDEKTLREKHTEFTKARLLQCSVEIWLYRFGGIPCLNTDEKIKWTYKNGQKTALSFFVEKITTEQPDIYAKARKVFDIQIYTKDKYKYSYPDIEKYLK
jgi:hypothetical protein